MTRQRSPTKCPYKSTNPPVSGGQGPYMDCRATDDDEASHYTTFSSIFGPHTLFSILFPNTFSVIPSGEIFMPLLHLMMTIYGGCLLQQLTWNCLVNHFSHIWRQKFRCFQLGLFLILIWVQLRVGLSERSLTISAEQNSFTARGLSLVSYCYGWLQDVLQKPPAPRGWSGCKGSNLITRVSAAAGRPHHMFTLSTTQPPCLLSSLACVPLTHPLICLPDI
jgi:hypothetical protein